MNPSDVDTTAFSTKEGHWAYKRMPFGLKTAPATLNNVLSGLTGTRCFVFLDDIVIYANSLVDHDRKLRDVFRRQHDKCEFLRKEVTFLGHTISEHGVEPDARNIKCIKNLPTPKTAKQLSFLGLTGYYRKFLHQFSKIAAPLHKLLKRDAKYLWEENQEIAFHTLKQKLMSQPILQYPDFSKEFILTTDASNDGAGAVSTQGQIGKDLPIAYASCSFNKAEKTIVQLRKN